jgi:hypothetical protein
MVLDATKNKRTDPEGEVDQLSASQAHLSNFDIDGPEVGVDGTRLKPKHIDFLNSLIAMIKGTPSQSFTIVIGGSTDTLNQSKQFDNQNLSERRAQAVQAFLQDRLPGGARVTFDTTGFGPAIQLPPNTPDDFSRAVDVALTVSGDPPPQRPRGPTPGGPVGPGTFPRTVFGCVREFEMSRSNNFKIRIADLSIVTASLGISIASIRFQIVDTDAQPGLGAEYTLSGGNNIFLERPEILRIVDNTSYRPFRTIQATRVTDFQSAVLQTGFGASLANPLGPLPKPKLSLTFKDQNGVAQSVQTDIDMNGKEGTLSRSITGSLTLDTTCRASRGGLEVDRTNKFL